MKAFIGTKLVNATPMKLGEYNTLRGWKQPGGEDPTQNGYLVEYTDGGKPNHPDYAGYISWSPKEVFENSYRQVGMNEIVDPSVNGEENRAFIIARELYQEARMGAIDPERLPEWASLSPEVRNSWMGKATNIMRGIQPADSVDVILSRQEPEIWQWGWYDEENSQWEPWQDCKDHTHVMQIQDHIDHGYNYRLRALYAGPTLKGSQMNFGEALHAMKCGERVAREGWNGKGLHVKVLDDSINLPHFAIVNKANTVQPGWVPSTGDLMADDWYVVLPLIG